MKKRITPSTPHDDLARVRAILDGSVRKWQSLVEEYAGLATALAARRLRDEDAARDVVVDVFTRLYRGQLATYNGEASFRTWFLLIVQRALVDHVRSQQGRTQEPRSIKCRPREQRRLFELFYVKGWPSQVVLEQLRAEGSAMNRDGFWNLVEEMDDGLDRRSRRRLRFEREARRIGGGSARWLEIVDDQRYLHRRRQSDRFEELERMQSGEVENVHAELDQLTELERRVLDLRFGHELSAREIADELKLTNTRQAFTLIDRGIRRLRRAVGTESTSE